MRIACFANSWLGWKIVDVLSRGEDSIAALVLHPSERRRHGEEILEAGRVSESEVLDGSRLANPSVFDRLAKSAPEMGISANFGYRLDPKVLSVFPQGCINVHTGLLPYNRGANPNVWSIVEGTPAGVTIHYMDAGLDTGDIIARRPVAVDATDTGESLYRRLERAALDLFVETWPSVRAGTAGRTPQQADEGTFHRVRDLDALDRIDPSRHYRAGELLDILRARTFPPYRGAYFFDGSRRIYVEVRLTAEPADTTDESTPAS